MATTHRRLPDPRLERFCREYVATGNGALSARRAGYSRHSAGVIANEVLKRPYVIERVQQLQLARLEKIADACDDGVMSAEEVLRRLSVLAGADRRELVDEDGDVKSLHEMDEDTAMVIEQYEQTERFAEDGTRETKRKVKTASQLQALRVLGEYHNLFKDHESNKAPAVTVNIAGKDAEA
jgi:phage terminase small subunit